MAPVDIPHRCLCPAFTQETQLHPHFVPRQLLSSEDTVGSGGCRGHTDTGSTLEKAKATEEIVGLGGPERG